MVGQQSGKPGLIVEFDVVVLRMALGSISQADLFGEPASASIRRHANVDAIEAFVGDRLRAAGFAKVAEPLRLLLRGGAPLYSLFFCISNPNPRAIALSMKAADHLLKAARRQAEDTHPRCGPPAAGRWRAWRGGRHPHPTPPTA